MSEPKLPAPDANGGSCGEREEDGAGNDADGFVSSIVFIGTGTSSGNPHVDCLLGLGKQGFTERGGCKVCKKSMIGDPMTNKNRRGNPSLLIVFNGHPDGERKFVQVDAGKTWRENAIRWFPSLGVKRLHAMILTHDHADATFGLDDLRMIYPRGSSLDVYLSAQTLMAVKKMFGYLTKANPIPSLVGAGELITEEDKLQIGYVNDIEQSKGEAYVSKTFVASLKWNVMCGPYENEAFIPTDVCGMPVIPFGVWHGEGYLSLGFSFGRGERKFVYISDISRMPDNVLAQLKIWQVRYLVIDALHPDKTYPTHMCMGESLKVIEEVRPHKAFLIGVSHSFDHDEANTELAKLKTSKGLDVQLAYDGLKIDLHDMEL